MSKVLQWLIQKLQTTRKFCEKNKLCTINTSLHVLPWLSCQDLAMILTSVPCIMICNDLDKGTMVNHELARFTMVPWLRTLCSYSNLHFSISSLYSHISKSKKVILAKNKPDIHENRSPFSE